MYKNYRVVYRKSNQDYVLKIYRRRCIFVLLRCRDTEWRWGTVLVIMSFVMVTTIIGVVA